MLGAQPDRTTWFADPNLVRTVTVKDFNKFHDR